MAENPDATPQDPAADDEALKKRLLSRLAIAGVMVVALLGGLAVLDALQEPEPKPAPPTEVAKTEPEEKPAEAKPEEKPEEKAEEKPAEKTEVAEAPKASEVPAEPEHTSSVPMPPPRPARPLTLPATPRAAIMKPSEPAAAPRKPDVREEIARTSPASPLVRHAPASRPLTAERTRQFVVQMGVFKNVSNAEELRAKLEAIGVPAQIEARVQVGPFATKQEAEAAREKLRAAGLEAGILTAIRR